MVAYIVTISRHGRAPESRMFWNRDNAESHLSRQRFKRFRASVSGSRQTWTRDSTVARVQLRVVVK